MLGMVSHGPLFQPPKASRSQGLIIADLLSQSKFRSTKFANNFHSYLSTLLFSFSICFKMWPSHSIKWGNFKWQSEYSLNVCRKVETFADFNLRKSCYKKWLTKILSRPINLAKLSATWGQGVCVFYDCCYIFTYWVPGIEGPTNICLMNRRVNKSVFIYH